jgi:hypothetical protein
VLFVVLLVAGAVPRGLSLRRQLLVFWPPLVLLGSWAILRLKRPRVTGAILLVSCLLAAAPVWGSPYQDWRQAARLIETEALPADTVLLTPAWSNMGFAYYYQGDPTYLGVNAAGFPPGHLTLVPGSTIWLVADSHPAMLEYSAGVSRWLDRHGEREVVYELPQYITVVKYRLRQ